jgi:hypothetical protein
MATDTVDVIVLPGICANLNWGGTNRDELYCTCSTSVDRVRPKGPGNPVASMRLG